MNKVTVIDSHTGGDPTGTVIAVGAKLGRALVIEPWGKELQRESDPFRTPYCRACSNAYQGWEFLPRSAPLPP